MPIQNIFDSHAHYNDGRFDADREELFASLPQNGVRRILHMGCDYATSLIGLEYQKVSPGPLLRRRRAPPGGHPPNRLGRRTVPHCRFG